jgi:hypothetical protein
LIALEVDTEDNSQDFFSIESSSRFSQQKVAYVFPKNDGVKIFFSGNSETNDGNIIDLKEAEGPPKKN